MDVTLVGNSATVTFESGVVTDKLYLLAGGAPGGLGTNGWEIVTLVDGAVDPSATSATVMLPEGWGDSVRAMRFAFNVDLGEPLEVERLGSITSPGNANNYVNALYVHKGNTRIDAVIDVPASQPRGPWCCVLGSRNYWPTYNPLCFYTTSELPNGKGYPVLNRVGEETEGSASFAFDTPVRLVIDGLTATWQDPETDEVKGSVTQTGTVLSGLCSLFIFNGNHATTASGIAIGGAGIKMTLYSFRIFEGDRLVRDFVPAKDGDGRLGLWDCVESVFSPALEGTFTSEIGRQTTVSKTVFAPLAPTAQPEDSLKIVGTPEDLGTVAPNYGLLTDLADGEVVELSAPAYFKTDTTVVSCSGYRLWQANGSTWTLVREAAKRRLSYHHVAGARAQLEWVWETAETDDADCGTGRTITAVTIEGKQVTVTFAAGTATDRLYLMTGSMPGGVGTNGWESIVCVNEAVGPSETSATFDLPREWGRKVRALRFGFNVELGEPLPGLRCASLDSPGTANSGYFPTGYTHSPSTRIDALINVASNQPRGNSGTWCCVLGARNEGVSKNALCFYATSSKANSYPVLNRVGAETVSSTGFTFDTPVRLVIDGLTATWRDPVTDAVKGSVTQTGTASDGFCQLILFDGNDATAADGIVRDKACTKMSLYAFKIYTGSKLERDYIPMRQNDAPGLWDRVSKTFTAAAVPSGGDALVAVPLERQVTFSSTLLAEPSPRRGMILKFQ